MSLVDLGKRLLEAAKRGDTEEVRQLMSNGAPFTTDWLGISPLHMAAQYGHLNTADVLIRAGISRDARTKVDRTPLHVAAQEGHIEIVQLLLKNGADVEAKDMLQMTPLHWAVERSRLPIIEILLKHCANVESLSKFEKSPIDIATDNGRLDIVQVLQSLKPDINEKILDSSPAAPTTTTILVTTPENTVSPTLTKVNTSNPVFIATNITAAASTTQTATIKLSTDDEASDQSSTSVLATLAALAEATASAPQSTSVSAQEALSWLESHGIAMVPADNSTVVTAAIEGGQTLSLTDAGKLALNWAKQQSNGNTEAAVDSAIDSMVGNSGTEQKVITIVADQAQLSNLTSNPRTTPILTAMLANLTQSVAEMKAGKATNGEPANKKVCISNSTSVGSSDELKVKVDVYDREQLKRELEEAQRQADDYKQQLLKKQFEAEEYKKQLDKISKKT